MTNTCDTDRPIITDYDLAEYKDYIRKMDLDELCNEVKTVKIQCHNLANRDSSIMLAALYGECVRRGQIDTFTAGHGQAMMDIYRREATELSKAQLVELEKEMR